MPSAREMTCPKIETDRLRPLPNADLPGEGGGVSPTGLAACGVGTRLRRCGRRAPMAIPLNLPAIARRSRFGAARDRLAGDAAVPAARA